MALPKVTCGGYVRYEPAPDYDCGCRIVPGRTRCGRVIQEGEEGGANYVGQCVTCGAEQLRERGSYARALERHVHHWSQKKTVNLPADPFQGFRE